MMSKSIADQMFPELSEQEIEELVTNVPPKDRRLITSAVDFSVSTLVDYVRDGTLRIPEFQRNYIWSTAKASRLIESLIMQCPIPVIYLARRSDDLLEVVDGNQRLTSIRRFIDGHFALSGLTAFPELVGSFYEELDARFQRHIQSKTIRCVIIEPESHPQIKFDVFERLNSGSTPLNAQELRHGIYSGAVLDLIAKLSANRDFIRLTGVKNNTRMKRDELVLRFLAFNDGYEGYEKPLSNFLNAYCEENRSMSKGDRTDRASSFEAVLLRIELCLGTAPFRLAATTDGVPKFNTAYYDALMTGFARSKIMGWGEQRVVSRRGAIEAAISALTTDAAFLSATLRATSDQPSVRHRIGAVQAALDAVN